MNQCLTRKGCWGSWNEVREELLEQVLYFLQLQGKCHWIGWERISKPRSYRNKRLNRKGWGREDVTGGGSLWNGKNIGEICFEWGVWWGERWRAVNFILVPPGRRKNKSRVMGQRRPRWGLKRMSWLSKSRIENKGWGPWRNRAGAPANLPVDICNQGSCGGRSRDGMMWLIVGSCWRWRICQIWWKRKLVRKLRYGRMLSLFCLEGEVAKEELQDTGDAAEGSTHSSRGNQIC